ncbi:MAG TPA: DUF6510 family protein [Nocardioidaceae bacterium]|nr:DUF6510 family protein [Nocardioidaceae bacterium]HSF26474.1 DUF6510 family protein [Actinomycetes bacterium]
MDTSPTFLDGNAAAGPMADVLGFDITVAVGRCAGCGESAVMAQCRVYSAGPGLVLRCSSCEHVLARLVVAGNRTWLEMTGIASLQIDSTA